MAATQDEPRWLNDEEQCTWQAYVKSRDLLDDYLNRQLQREAGIAHAHYGLMVFLADAPEHRLRMTELAQRAKITRSRLSYSLTRLEKDGWARREVSNTDRRVQFAILTDAGMDMMRRVAPGHVEAVRHAVFDVLTPEQVRQLGEICEAVADRLEPAENSQDLPWLR